MGNGAARAVNDGMRLKGDVVCQLAGRLVRKLIVDVVHVAAVIDGAGAPFAHARVTDPQVQAFIWTSWSIEQGFVLLLGLYAMAVLMRPSYKLQK